MDFTDNVRFTFPYYTYIAFAINEYPNLYIGVLDFNSYFQYKSFIDVLYSLQYHNNLVYC